VFSPPKHQGHQAHPPTLFEPQRTQRAQSHPPTQKRRGAEPQRRRESCWRLHRTARFQPPTDCTRCHLNPEDVQEQAPMSETPWSSFDGQGTTGSGNRFESKLSCRFPDPVVYALAERRSRHFSSSSNCWEGHALLPNNEREERQNRRATGASVGEKTGSDGCLHPERSGFSPATGDRPIACRSAVNKRNHLTGSVIAPLRLCASARAEGRAALRFFSVIPLCVSVPLWFCRCFGDAKTLYPLA